MYQEITKKYTNNEDISLSVAVFLATDLYDHSINPKQISVTTLIRPIKQIVLASRIKQSEDTTDISEMIDNQSGTALHTAIENAWIDNYKDAMQSLGYSKKVINRIYLNPTEEELNNIPNIIPVYLEHRSSKEINGYIISGKFDIVTNGTLEDFKQTSVYTYIYKSNDKNYQLQGSIYRWLNPDKIISDHMLIQYFFKDWRLTDYIKNKRQYPSKKQLAYKVPLLSIQETDNYVRNKVSLLKEYWDKPEEDMPRCTDEDLWRKPTVWKYYKNPNKRTRSTANFSNQTDAYTRYNKDGNVGIVIEVKGQAKACLYCPAYSICKQKDEYFPPK